VGTRWTSPGGIVFMAVPGGSFVMGGHGVYGYETEHQVSLSGFWMSRTEVTQAQWEAVMGVNPSSREMGLGPEIPVNMVSWYDILAFCNRLSIKEGFNPVYRFSGSTNPDQWGKVPSNWDPAWDAVTMDMQANGYRLPTEAEWEFAARGGTASRGYLYSGGNDADAVGWDSVNSNLRLQPVGRKVANELGLHDMNGNVAEWVWDRWGKYTAEAVSDPVGPTTGWTRPVRGGSIHGGGVGFRPFQRGNAVNPQDRVDVYGFRMVCGGN
jgi:formylglycine-generating enzyme required for sulfatase activity